MYWKTIFFVKMKAMGCVKRRRLGIHRDVKIGYTKNGHPVQLWCRFCSSCSDDQHRPATRRPTCVKRVLIHLRARLLDEKHEEGALGTPKVASRSGMRAYH